MLLSYTAVYVEPTEALPYDGDITNQSLGWCLQHLCCRGIQTGELEWVTLLDGKMAEGAEDRDELILRQKDKLNNKHIQ